MKKRFLAVVGELDAIDGMLDDVFEIRIRQLVDPDGKPPPHTMYRGCACFSRPRTDLPAWLS